PAADAGPGDRRREVARSDDGRRHARGGHQRPGGGRPPLGALADGGDPGGHDRGHHGVPEMSVLGTTADRGFGLALALALVIAASASARPAEPKRKRRPGQEPGAATASLPWATGGRRGRPGRGRSRRPAAGPSPRRRR